MIEGFLNLEKAALQQLTEDRIATGSLGVETEEVLASAGIYWDELGQEYFNIDTFQRELFGRLVAEYVSQDYA